MAATFSQPAAPNTAPSHRASKATSPPSGQSDLVQSLQSAGAVSGERWESMGDLAIIVLADSNEQRWVQYEAWKGQIQRLGGQILLFDSEQVYA